MSYQIIRKFSKRVEIVSFEPIKENFNILKKIKGRDALFNCYNNALSNKNINEIFLVPGDTNLQLMDAIGRN